MPFQNPSYAHLFGRRARTHLESDAIRHNMPNSNPYDANGQKVQAAGARQWKCAGRVLYDSLPPGLPPNYPRPQPVLFLDGYVQTGWTDRHNYPGNFTIPIASSYGFVFFAMIPGIRLRFTWCEVPVRCMLKSKDSDGSDGPRKDILLPTKPARAAAKFFRAEFTPRQPWKYLFMDGPANPYNPPREYSFPTSADLEPYLGSFSRTLSPISASSVPGLAAAVAKTEDLGGGRTRRWTLDEAYPCEMSAGTLVAFGGLFTDDGVEEGDSINNPVEPSQTLLGGTPRGQFQYNTPNLKIDATLVYSDR